GEPLSVDRVKEISKWPNRQEQLSILVGQILAPGAQLVSQLLGPGGALASQIEKKAKDESPDEAAEQAAPSAEVSLRSRRVRTVAVGRVRAPHTPVQHTILKSSQVRASAARRAADVKEKGLLLP